MEIIRVDADEYGCIGLALSKELAIDFLIEDGWLGSDVEIYNYEKDDWMTIMEALGEEWGTELKSWSLEELQNYFDGLFYFEKMEVYDGK